MDMSGSYQIPAPRDTVWAALNDIDVLKACIPGCESITKHSETELEATVSAKVGPVKAKFTGAVTLSDLDPPNGYTISGEGKGGAAGFAKGGAKVHLEQAGSGTTLTYEVTANVGGKLAQIGSRLIDSTAKKMADQFFSKLSAEAFKASPMAEGEEVPFPKASPEPSTVASRPMDSMEPPEPTVAKSISENREPDALNTFTPISFGVWAFLVSGLFALGLIWLILG